MKYGGIVDSGAHIWFWYILIHLGAQGCFKIAFWITTHLWDSMPGRTLARSQSRDVVIRGKTERLILSSPKAGMHFDLLNFFLIECYSFHLFSNISKPNLDWHLMSVSDQSLDIEAVRIELQGRPQRDIVAQPWGQRRLLPLLLPWKPQEGHGGILVGSSLSPVPCHMKFIELHVASVPNVILARNNYHGEEIGSWSIQDTSIHVLSDFYLMMLCPFCKQIPI